MASRIITKKGSGAPLASDLVHGELAVDTVNKRLYTENAGGSIIELGTAPSTIDINAGTIDGTVIGGSTAAAGTFTTGQFNTSVNVDGTVTADGLTVDGSARIEETGAAARLVVSRTDALNTVATASVDLLEGSAGGSFGSANNYGFSIDLDGSANTLNVLSGNQTTVTKRLSVARDTGDISFYEDTGTTAKFFWDASAESLGIGTSSPSALLDVKSDAGMTLTDAGNARFLRLSPATSAGAAAEIESTSANGLLLNASGTGASMRFRTDASEAMRITSSGNVGIGTDDPQAKLDVSASGTGASAPTIRITNTLNSGDWSDTTDAMGRIEFYSADTSGNAPYTTGFIECRNDFISGSPTLPSGALVFGTTPYDSASGATERMRIDSSGNVGIGTTNPAVKLQTTVANASTEAIRITNSADSVRTHMLPAEFQAHNSDLTLNAVDGFATIFKTANTEAMRIDSSGSVGIGTSSPSRLLTVSKNQTSDTAIEVSNLGSASSTTTSSFIVSETQGSPVGWFRRYRDGSGRTSIGYTTNFIIEDTAGSERLRIDSSGNLFVGTTSGNFSAKITSENSSSYTFESRRTGTGSEGHVVFRNANGSVGTIFTSGTTTSYNTSSDERLKENITDANDAGDKIDAIKVRQYDWKVDGSHQDYGMVAQELMTVAPEAVSGDPESDEMMGVDYSKLVPMMLKEIQSLRARVAQLEGAN